MPKSNYIQATEAGFSAQLQTFKNNIGAYATVVGVSPTQVTAQAADADYYAYTLACADAIQRGAQQWNTWKSLLRNGGTPPPDGLPVAPVLPESVTAVGLGIEPRFRALVKQVKAHAGYNDAIGQALGIVGAAQAGPDPATVQPEFDVKLIGDKVLVDWGWQKFGEWLDLCELQVDRGDGKGWVPLAFDTTPGYYDTAPWPATPTKWTYRAIYRVGDERVGLWSKPVAVLVG